jgi:pimeloyl-ACP methyl ester carboxylesterase
VTGGLENWADWLDAWCANGLAGVLHRLTQPMIVVFGQLDRLVPWQQAVQVADEAPGASLWMFDEGNHVCMNMTYRWRPRAADWLAERLAEAD